MNRLLIIIRLLTACSFCIQLAFDEKGKHKINSKICEKNIAMIKTNHRNVFFENLEA